MKDAVLMLLDSLEEHQRARAVHPWEDGGERTRWFYTPTDHGGLPLGEMAPLQQQRVFAVLAAALSEPAYATASTIIGLENVLSRAERFVESPWRPATRSRDPGLYYVSVFGDPSSDTWSWRFGGHHVSLHRTYVDGELVSSTPSFFGANPADTLLLGGGWLRPLAAYEDLARELVHAHPDAVVAAEAPADLASGNRPFLSVGDSPMHTADLRRGATGDAPGPDVDPAIPLTREPRGVATPDLRELVDAYAEQAPGADLDAGDMRFLWAGGIEKGEPHYYRLQSHAWLVEYDNVQAGANHIHTVVRSWDGDFGRDVLSRHHREHH